MSKLSEIELNPDLASFPNRSLTHVFVLANTGRGFEKKLGKHKITNNLREITPCISNRKTVGVQYNLTDIELNPDLATFPNRGLTQVFGLANTRRDFAKNVGKHK